MGPQSHHPPAGGDTLPVQGRSKPRCDAVAKAPTGPGSQDGDLDIQEEEEEEEEEEKEEDMTIAPCFVSARRVFPPYHHKVPRSQYGRARRPHVKKPEVAQRQEPPALKQQQKPYQ